MTVSNSALADRFDGEPAVPWVERPTLTLDVAKPWPQQFDAFPRTVVAESRRLLAAVQEQLPPRALHLAHLARLRTRGRFHNELEAIARWAEVDWRFLLLASLSYDLLLASLACSTAALATADGPVLARNMDWWPEDLLARASNIIRYERGGRLLFANAGWPGAVGVVTGLSGNGFALALNAVFSRERHSLFGYPVLLLLRRVVEEAADFAAARDWLCRQRFASPAIITLVGVDNHERVVIERSPTKYAVRVAAGNEPLVTTNDYHLLESTARLDGNVLIATSCPRFDRLTELVRHHLPTKPVADAALLFALTDANVLQTITAQHVILRPRDRSIRLFVPRRLLAG